MFIFLKKIRKAFLTKFFRIHYSQFGEDIVIKEYLANTKDGFFVDVGCWHPKKFNNTYFLYKKGWRGINIDMEAHKIDLFNLCRRKDINLVAAVSNIKEDIFIVRDRQYDLGAKLSLNENKNAIKTTTKTLTDLIDATPYKGREIDLLSIDAEGHDLNVLLSLNFEIYNPKIVIIELNTTDIDELINSKLHLFMVEKNYKLVSWVHLSLIYVIPNLTASALETSRR